MSCGFLNILMGDDSHLSESERIERKKRNDYLNANPFKYEKWRRGRPSKIKKEERRKYNSYISACPFTIKITYKQRFIE